MCCLFSLLLVRSQHGGNDRGINDADVVAIAEAVKNSSTIQYLEFVVLFIELFEMCSRYSLEKNRITDVRAILLAESLIGNNTLKYLSYVLCSQILFNEF